MSKTPNILVLTDIEDYHSFAVSEGLRKKGVAHSLWFSADFPSRQSGSVWLDPLQATWELSGPEIDLRGSEEPTTIWVRRLGRPVLSDEVLPEDRQFAYRECLSFIDGLRAYQGERAFWVNSLEGAKRANRKLEQLRCAARHGFPIPPTLMSNDPDRIKEFLRQHSPAIYKSFYPFSWQAQNGLAATFCSPISLEDLPDDSILKLSPGIFQALVTKKYELRVTAIGNHIFAAKIDSQAAESAKLDWRAATEALSIEPAELPSTIEHACRSIMGDLGIVFGCFDIVRTIEDEYVFLEVNEMGAFLWIEEQNPEFRLVDAFCEFLRQGKVDFSRSKKSSCLRLADIQAAALQKMKKEAPHLHVREPRAAQNDAPI